MDSVASFVPERTADGSYTFFSAEFGERFHSRDGAFQEALKTYVEPTHLPTKALQSHLVLLDVCYGLGYNTAAALETIWRLNPTCHIQWIGLELNPDVPQAAIAQGFLADWSAPVQAVLQQLAFHQRVQTARLDATLLIGDGRQQIQQIPASFQADAIFLDPFSPPRCPMLWSVEFLQQVARCLKPDGRLATYSCAAAVRSALQQAGLYLGTLPVPGRRWPGTVAGFCADQLPPLCQREIEHLQTKAAVPYRDRTLSASRETILQQRQQAQAQSSLRPTSQWRKRWLSGDSSDSKA